MLEEILEYISPYLGTFTQIILYALAIAIGAALLLCLIRLAVNVCYTVEDCAERIKQWTTGHKEGFRKKWSNRFSKLADKIGKAVVDALKQSNAELSVDHRPDMLGKWISNRGDYMTIEDHKGYYTVTFEGIPKPNDPDFGSFMLRDLQGWLHDHNVYCAEGYRVLTLAISDNLDEIFIAELNRTYHRYDPIAVSAALHELTKVKEDDVEFFREDHIYHSNAGPEVVKISEEEADSAFSDLYPEVQEPIKISSEVRERIRKIAFNDESDESLDSLLNGLKR